MTRILIALVACGGLLACGSSASAQFGGFKPPKMKVPEVKVPKPKTPSFNTPSWGEAVPYQKPNSNKQNGIENMRAPGSLAIDTNPQVQYGGKPIKNGRSPDVAKGPVVVVQDPGYSGQTGNLAIGSGYSLQGGGSARGLVKPSQAQPNTRTNRKK